MFTEEIEQSVKESVLCWLATSDENGYPSCSPKEAFTVYGENEVVIANIASPGSVKKIECNPNVCVSFINIFKQRGFKLKGTASYLSLNDSNYQKYAEVLSPIIGDAFPIQGIIVVQVSKSEPIIAPSYYLVSGTTVESQIAQARKTYGI